MNFNILIANLFWACTALPLFATRLYNSDLIQILPDGTHRAQQKDGKIAEFCIKNGKSTTVEILWQLPNPDSKFITGANSNVDTTVAELVHGACGEIDVPVTSVVKIVVGTRHACLLRENGDVMCWGDNSFCQLGPTIPPGSFTTKAVHFPRLKTAFSALEVFGTVTCASNARSGVCWGALHPIKTTCLDRNYSYTLPDGSALMRMPYAVVIVSKNSTITKSVVGGTMYVGRAAETSESFDPAAVCSITESMVECRNIHGFYVGNVFPLLSKPYSESLTPGAQTRDGLLLSGQPGCGYNLTFGGIQLASADAAAVREYQTSHGCLRILSCANAVPNNTVALNSVVKLVSGDSHVCLLDSAGDVYCRGSNFVCQFISAEHTLGAWSKISTPLKATNLFAHRNVTCVSDENSAFCTGCISAGCMCTHRITFTQADIKNIDITDSGVCIETACVGTKGVTAFTDSLCIMNKNSISCGEIVYAAPGLNVFAASKETVVFTTLDGRMCVSDNGLRSVSC